MHQVVGWQKDRTVTLFEAVFGDKLLAMPKDGRLLFSPMGMAIFDIAVATYTLKLARDRGIGIELH
jgi:ornithine cyclodeaminase